MSSDDAIQLMAAKWAEREWSRRMTAADREALDQWLATDPRHAVAFESATQLMSSDELTGALASAARDYGIQPTRAQPSRPWLQPFWVGMGAMVTAAAAVFAVMTLMPAQIVPSAPAVQVAANVRLTSAVGEPRIELLPDGSRIDLNGGTALAVTFTSTGRSIELVSGDAAFQVAPDASRPFVVSTPHLSATALGTAFTVSRFDGHSSVRVTEHEVRIASKAAPMQSVVAKPGDTVDIDETGTITVTHDGNAVSDDWRNGWIDTQAMTIADLAATMQRRTGQTIIVAPPVGSLTVSGRFRIDEPETVLRRLELLHGLDVTKTRDGFALAAASPG